MAENDEQNASTSDVQSALDTVRDPDTIPAGGVQATTTEEAKGEARKLLARLPRTDEESGKLRKDIESNAKESIAALKRAQELLVSRPDLFFPSDQEIANRQAAALTHPNPGVGMAGALSANFSNLYGEEAEEAAARRTGTKAYLETLSGLPYQQQIEKINELQNAARQKLLDMHTKQDTDLSKAAMTQLGRMAASPTLNKALTPNSPFGKIAIDEGLQPGTPEYQARVNQLAEIDVRDKQARAGTDERPLSPEEKHENANLAGVPAAPLGVPDTSRMSTPQRKQYLSNETKFADSQMKDYGARDEQTRAALRALDEFQELNKVTHTGPDTQPFTLGGVHAGPHGIGADLSQDHGGLDLNPYSWFNKFKPNFQTMNKLASQVVAQAIPASGFGRVTNRDLGLFQQGSIGTDKTQQTNDAIAQALRIRLNNDLQRHMFEQAYLGHHETIRGAENSWNNYLADNPIFDPKDPNQGKAGHYTLNPHRMEWQEYFRTKNGPLQSAPVENIEGHQGRVTKSQLHGTDPNDPALQGLTDEEKVGATTPAQAGGGSVQMAEGGQPDEGQIEGSSAAKDALHALINGLTMKAAPQPENPNNPGINFGGELLGAGTTAAGLLAALRRPQGLARLMAKYPKTTASVAGGVAGGLAGGMGTGDPVTSAGAGAVLGPMAHLGIKSGYGGVQDALDRLAGRVINPGTRKSIQAIQADTGGDWDKVGNILEQDAKLKVPSILGETGPRSTGLTVAAMRKDTPQGADLLTDLQGRQAGAGERVADQTNQALAPDNYLAKTQELRDNLYTKAAPLYDQAFSAFPSVKSDTLMQIMNTPSGQEAAMRAFRMMQDQRMPIGSPDAAGMVANPSLQYLDQIKRAMDDMITSEEGVGPNYQATQQGRVLRQMRSQLVDELDKNTMGPQGQPSPYRAARNQYAGDLDIMDSLRVGRETFSKLTADDVRSTMAKLDYSSRDAFRSGVAEGIFQQIASLGPDRNAAQAIIANPKLQEKIAAIFDDPKQAQRFIESLQREAQIFQSGKALTASGLKGQLTSMQPTSVSTMLRHSLMGKDTAGQVAETMGTGALDPDAKDKMARLREIADRLKGRSSIANLAGNAGAAGVAVAGSPTPMEQQ